MTERTDVDTVKALVAFGRVGLQMMGARILSIVALLGYLGLAGYVAYNATWHGVTVCAILALVAISAFRAENRYRDQAKESQQ